VTAGTETPRAGGAARRGRRATATTNTLSLVNQTAIVEALKARGPMSRQEIGYETGLSPATVNRLTAALMANRYVVQHGVEPSTGGRPSILLRYTGAYRVVAALQVRRQSVTGVLVDFDGQIIQRIHVDAPAVPDESTVGDENGTTSGGSRSGAEKIRRLMTRLVRAAEKRGTPCLAIGVSVPYVVDTDGNISGVEEGTQWTDLATSDLIDPRLGVPVFIENDANALAIGELHRGVGRTSPHFVALLLARGLGAGIVANGALLRGSRSSAGEVGYLLLGESSLSRTYPEGGDLETRIGAEALTAEARRRGLQIAPGSSVSATDIFSLAHAGDPIAEELSSEVLDYIARAVAAVSSVLDPECVILGEGLDHGRDFIGPALESRLTGRINRVPAIRPATLGEDAVILGAAETAMRAVSQFTYVAS
jgi:predicted NBD/HSP70 family sugar kinase